MAYRVLVDENTSPRVATALGEAGLDAVHVAEALDTGVTDDRILDYARDYSYVVLTHDHDFLRPDRRGAVPILFYADDSLDSVEIVERVEQVVQYVPDPDDLPAVTNLGRWE